MKKYLLSLLLILSLFLTSCKSSNEIRLDLKPILSEDKLKVEIKTNLPENTKAVISLINVDKQYTAYDEVNLKDKKTISNEFSDSGKALPKGQYSITLVIPVTEVQPKSVQNVVGVNYKNITSEYIVETGGYKYLLKNMTFDID